MDFAKSACSQVMPSFTSPIDTSIYYVYVVLPILFSYPDDYMETATFDCDMHRLWLYGHLCSEAVRQVMSFLDSGLSQSYDQPGCAQEPPCALSLYFLTFSDVDKVMLKYLFSVLSVCRITSRITTCQYQCRVCRNCISQQHH